MCLKVGGANGILSAFTRRSTAHTVRLQKRRGGQKNFAKEEGKTLWVYFRRKVQVEGKGARHRNKTNLQSYKARGKDCLFPTTIKAFVGGVLTKSINCVLV